MSDELDSLRKEVADLRKNIQQHDEALDRVVATLGAIARSLGDYSNVAANTFIAKPGNNYSEQARDAIWPAYQAMNTLVTALERLRDR